MLNNSVLFVLRIHLMIRTLLSGTWFVCTLWDCINTCSEEQSFDPAETLSFPFDIKFTSFSWRCDSAAQWSARYCVGGLSKFNAGCSHVGIEWPDLVNIKAGLGTGKYNRTSRRHGGFLLPTSSAFCQTECRHELVWSADRTGYFSEVSKNFLCYSKLEMQRSKLQLNPNKMF